MIRGMRNLRAFVLLTALLAGCAHVSHVSHVAEACKGEVTTDLRGAVIGALITSDYENQLGELALAASECLVRQTVQEVLVAIKGAKTEQGPNSAVIVKHGEDWLSRHSLSPAA